MLSMDFVMGCLVATRRGMAEDTSRETIEALGREASAGGPEKPLVERAMAAWERAAPTQRSSEIRWLAAASDGRWQSLSRAPVLDRETADRVRGAGLSVAMVFGHPRKRGRVGVVVLDDAAAAAEPLVEKRIASDYRALSAAR